MTHIQVLGAGPAGLYVAILLRKAMPRLRVTVTEQNPDSATFGFGVVFSDQALSFLKADDPETHDLITPRMERWENMTLDLQGQRVTLDGVGFSAIGRLELLQLLQARARSEGVELRYGTNVGSLNELDGDLVIGADGVNSLVRSALESSFGVERSYFNNRFAWFGTSRPFDTLTQTFVRTPHGVMNAHHYRYTPNRSTFIVECDAKTFHAEGFDMMDEGSTARACGKVFADTLGGAPLIANRSMWRQFPKLWCRNWVAGKYVLLGDAAHTAHYSIGSGTRLAMEDAIVLARSLTQHGDIQTALSAFEAERQPIAKKIVDAANTSALWYDQFATKMDMHPLDFAFDYITRSGRVDMHRLRAHSPLLMAAYEDHKRGMAL